jgi:two-component system, OmpR family, KDP operon response regulator KdpE
MIRVLVVDDEARIRRLLRLSLNARGFEIYDARTGREALDGVIGCKPDIVILDLGLPDLDGMDMLKELRTWSSVPVIVLSVRNAEEDIVASLNAGADDYLVKPFNMGELVARINASLRRLRPPQGGEVFRSATLSVDIQNRRVLSGDREGKLTPPEYGILRFLVSHAGKIVTNPQILQEVWGPTACEESQYLRVYVGSLRRKIEREPSRPEILVTEPGVGYRIRILPPAADGTG